MYTTLSGQLAITKHLDIIANNLANMNTSGFRAERPLFEKALNKEEGILTTSLKKDIQQPSPYSTDSYVEVKGTLTDFSQGPIETTGNPLDAAIDGPGFFVVNTPQGERYTRAGNFRLDSQNRLVSQGGMPVQGTGGDITITGKQITIQADGTILADKEVAGKLRVVKFDAKDSTREAGLLFSLKSGGVASEVTDVKVQGGAVEGSNVNAVRELAEMITASRLFETFQTVRQENSKMNELANQRVGSTNG